MFDELGVMPGTPLPALMDETPVSIAVAVGGAMSRRPLAPLGTKFSVADLAEIVRHLDTPHLFASPERAELGAAVAAAAGVVLHVVSDTLPMLDPLEIVCAADDTAVIVHTSGTTGRAKPVHLRHAPLVARVGVYQDVMGIGPGDRYCSASAFYHTAGSAMIFTVLPMGVAIIPMDWFSVEGWRLSGRLGVTCSLLVPTMIDILLAEGALADANPKVLQYGASPIHPDTLRAAMADLPNTRFLQIFGQTELSPISYLDHADHLRAAAGRPDLLTSAGRAIQGTRINIEQPDDDGIGEIAVKAAHAFASDDDGWRRTGDLGLIDAEGYLHLHGRINDRIIRGGENIYPSEIEAAVSSHPSVREAAVVGVPDRRWGETVRAVVVPNDPALPPDLDELRQHVASLVAGFKVPAEFVLTDELPRNPSGKILRRALRGEG
jgi:acyl-CoA synthetase (AMP-forming)/AMP-acid ligase II